MSVSILGKGGFLGPQVLLLSYFRVGDHPELQDRSDSNLETRFGLLSISDVQSLTFV